MTKKKKGGSCSKALTPIYAHLGDNPYKNYLPRWAQITKEFEVYRLGKENLKFLKESRLKTLPPHKSTFTRHQAVTEFFDKWLVQAQSKPLLPACRPLDYFHGKNQLVFHPKKLGNPKNRFVIIKHFQIKGMYVVFNHYGRTEHVPIQSPFVLTLADYHHFKDNPQDAVLFSSSYYKTHQGFNSRQWREDLKLNTFTPRQNYHRSPSTASIF